MKPYGGWSFREWKTVEWIFLPQMKIATTWTGIFFNHWDNHDNDHFLMELF